MDRLEAECPGLAVLLGRYFAAPTIEALAEDYYGASARGANQEFGVVREEGVSFNPRLARILTLLLREGGVRDPWVMRVAMYGAASSEGSPLEELDAQLAAEVRLLTLDPCSGSPWHKTIALAYILDRVRHLHMTTMTVSEREEYLRTVEQTSIVSGDSPRDPFLGKVRHAITLQRKRLSIDSQTL